ncbi:MAG: flavin reductase family protein [Chloroflexota bacterium]|nr:flavin reductase family protein [Chloroflexota bacterium]
MDPAAKKTVLRHMSYGMYAITAAHDGERGVFTANWLSQVSFEPPLVVVSVELDSATLPLIRGSRKFAICPFADDQRQLAADLGRPKARAGDKYAALDLSTIDTEQGVPVLADTLGYVICQVRAELPAGDSVVVLAEVIDAGVLNEGEPLTMRAAGFRHAG